MRLQAPPEMVGLSLADLSWPATIVAAAAGDQAPAGARRSNAATAAMPKAAPST